MFSLHVCLFTTCVLVPAEAKRGRQIPSGIGALDSCWPPCGYKELNLGPLEVKLVFPTAESSLQFPKS